ncbi:MAG: hypothetical protein HOP12_15485 [Candidatus Eisenbacteria bacterium]|uniref:Spondin domain-containing protein n=1 Tax=Eiseniibacteriota bacterium TaxID=2212470 RepID=A0A849SLS8_UNCEI|nr:hypothetical protein [Candidatus Eisenbacteria bacterium]
MSRQLMVAVLAALVIPSLAAADHNPMHHWMKFTVTVENVSTAGSLQLSTGGTAPAPTSPVIFLTHTSNAPLFKAGTADRGKGLEHLAEDGNPSMLVQNSRGVKGISTVDAVAIPVGDDKAGPALPGKKFVFTFTANPGEKLTAAMMFGQSNDWFYAPSEKGIELWTKQGEAVAGDITSQFLLWNAGTEVDEEPGVGANQGPRQKAPNSGPAENGKVGLAKGYAVPAVNQVIKVTIAPEAMAAK